MLTLLDLHEGPLSHVLSFLDTPDLTSIQQTTRWLAARTPLAWNSLDAAVVQGPSTYHHIHAVSGARIRCQRYFKAQRYARTMDYWAARHYDYDKPVRSHTLCRECTHWVSTLRPQPIHNPQAYEFFVRMAYRKPPAIKVLHDPDDPSLIWQGFVPSIPSRGHRVFLDTQRVALTWPAMDAYLAVVDTHGADISTDHPDVLASLYEAVDNLQITVVALDRVSHHASLVVATGGFHDAVEQEEDDGAAIPAHGYLLNPRNVRTHSLRKDQDWMQVEICTTGGWTCWDTGTELCTRQAHPARFRGISVTHECS